MRPSRQEASTQLPSCDSAMAVTGAPSWSTSMHPMRTSKRRTVPSTLLARISALHASLVTSKTSKLQPMCLTSPRPCS